MKSYSSFSIFLETYKTSTKLLFNVLQHYFGVNQGRIWQIFKIFGFSLNLRCFCLLESDWLRLKDYILSFFGERSRILRLERRNVERLRVLKTYKGLRHSLFLPVRGQRTHTNAQTQKNKRQGRQKQSFRRKI